MIKLINGDCREVLGTLESNSVDSIVTDPPAGIAFMGKQWDRFDGRNAANISLNGEQYASANPGAPVYGNSAKPTKPKSGERAAFINFLTPVMAECLRIAKPGAYALVWAIPRTSHWTATAIEDAGWVVQDCITHLFGTGFPKHKSKLKPGAEFWWLAWKPAKKATPLQIDACRIGTFQNTTPSGMDRFNEAAAAQGYRPGTYRKGEQPASTSVGRWPANVTLDAEAAAMLDEQSGAARFFYCAKASRDERDAGCESLPETEAPTFDERPSGDFSKRMKRDRRPVLKRNTHPTVKPLSLMRWLCRLITPPGGTVLDPFAGSGTTLVACQEEGFDAIGIEREAEYAEIVRRRLAEPSDLFAGTP